MPTGPNPSPDQMLETFGDRLLKMMELFRLKPSAFAAKLDMKPQTLNGFTGPKQSGATLKTIQKIVAAFPRVNSDWLITGQGEPLRPLGESSSATYQTGNSGNTVGTMSGGSVSQNINSAEDLRAALAACQQRNKELESTVADMRMVIDVLKGQK